MTDHGPTVALPAVGSALWLRRLMASRTVIDTASARSRHARLADWAERRIAATAGLTARRLPVAAMAGEGDLQLARLPVAASSPADAREPSRWHDAAGSREGGREEPAAAPAGEGIAALRHGSALAERLLRRGDGAGTLGVGSVPSPVLPGLVQRSGLQRRLAVRGEGAGGGTPAGERSGGQDKGHALGVDSPLPVAPGAAVARAGDVRPSSPRTGVVLRSANPPGRAFVSPGDRRVPGSTAADAESPEPRDALSATGPTAETGPSAPDVPRSPGAMPRVRETAMAPENAGGQDGAGVMIGTENGAPPAHRIPLSLRELANGARETSVAFANGQAGAGAIAPAATTSPTIARVSLPGSSSPVLARTAPGAPPAILGASPHGASPESGETPPAAPEPEPVVASLLPPDSGGLGPLPVSVQARVPSNEAGTRVQAEAASDFTGAAPVPAPPIRTALHPPRGGAAAGADLILRRANPPDDPGEPRPGQRTTGPAAAVVEPPVPSYAPSAGDPLTRDVPQADWIPRSLREMAGPRATARPPATDDRKGDPGAVTPTWAPAGMLARTAPGASPSLAPPLPLPLPPASIRSNATPSGPGIEGAPGAADSPRSDPGGFAPPAASARAHVPSGHGSASLQAAVPKDPASTDRGETLPIRAALYPPPAGAVTRPDSILQRAARPDGRSARSRAAVPAGVDAGPEGGVPGAAPADATSVLQGLSGISRRAIPGQGAGVPANELTLAGVASRAHAATFAGSQAPVGWSANPAGAGLARAREIADDPMPAAPAMVWRAAGAVAAPGRLHGLAADPAAAPSLARTAEAQPVGTASPASIRAGGAPPIGTPAAAGVDAPPDPARLAEQVARIVARRLEIERERRGGGNPWR